MCGIAGYIGKGNVGIKLVGYLEKLEYRGYDSAGVAIVLPRGEISVVKRAGEVKKLKIAVPGDEAQTGIAHTRWATHGRADEINAHPHLSPDGSWAVVHNGIIENFDDLKRKYFADEEFFSRTDSEIIPRLLGRFAREKTMAGFMKCVRLLAGSFAIAAVAEGRNEIYLAKEKSPLYVAKKGTFLTVASDPICF
ncbi:MAG: class II glutamine amidotransferase, partial [Clostridia bacterium]|nr:class II glutamine amidotransferase [Clostridia bacterium]